MEELKNYHKQTIKKFLTELLEVDSDIAENDSTIISESVSEQSLVKLVHFLDCMYQCSNTSVKKSCSGNADCGSCCGKCNCAN